MVSQKVKIINPTGLHLRPAGNLCKEAMKYNSKITFEYSGNTANAKSVLSVLGACIKSEMRLHLSVTEKMNREHFGNWSLMWKADWANKIFAGYNRKTTC